MDENDGVRETSTKSAGWPQVLFALPPSLDFALIIEPVSHPGISLPCLPPGCQSPGPWENRTISGELPGGSSGQPRGAAYARLSQPDKYEFQ
jgi:hypothetical protein